MRGLGFRALGLGFEVRGLGLAGVHRGLGAAGGHWRDVWGVGFGAQGLEQRLYSVGFRV